MNKFESFGRESGEGLGILRQLEAENRYIFHGTHTAGIEEFEPRQPQDWTSGKPLDHGMKSVVGTTSVEIPIFRALVNKDWTGWSSDGNSFEASKIALQEAEGGKGYVYVFDRNEFEQFEGEWRAYKPVKPLRVIEVKAEDLPSGIQVIHGDLR